MRFCRSILPSGFNLVVLGAVVALVAGLMTSVWAAVPSTAPRSGDDSATAELSPEALLLEWGSTALNDGRYGFSSNEPQVRLFPWLEAPLELPENRCRSREPVSRQ